MIIASILFLFFLSTQNQGSKNTKKSMNNNTSNKEAIEKGTRYLKNKIDSKQPFSMKSIAKGDVKKCPNCMNPYTGSIIYGFFISQAIGERLDKNEINTLLRNINTPGESLWGYETKEKIKEWNDSDDTAFAMRTLEKLKIDYKLNDIEFFYNKDTKDFSSFRENQLMQDSKENYKSHSEVNANIYNLLLETKQRNNFEINKNLIKNSQNEDGSFKSYFYPSKYYSTYMFLKFLCEYKDVGLDEIKNKAINFIQKSQNINGSWGNGFGNNYETALALASLKTCGVDNEKASKIILENQNKDGSWDSNEVFWKFRLSKEDSWETYTNSIITTSINLIALKNN